MARVSPKQNRFSRGQISAKLHGSQDLELYYTALELCRNYVVDGRGMLERKPGTRFMARTKDDKPAILIPFAYDQKQAYTLEFTDGVMRALYNGGLVLNGGVPFEFSTSYMVADMKEISFHQLNDILWLALKDYQFRIVKRIAADEFDIDLWRFKDGPYLDINTTPTYLKPSSRGSLTPLMTANNAPSGAASDSGGSADAFKAFDGDPGTFVVVPGSSGWIQFIPTAPEVVDGYFLLAPATTAAARMPVSWVVEGWDGAAWNILDSRSGESDWVGGDRKVYAFNNQQAFSRYRLRWTSSLATPGDNDTVIAEIGFNIAGDFQTAFNLTASSTDGINNDLGWLNSDVGRNIRVLGGDNIWRYFVVTSRVSATVVTVNLYGPPLTHTDRIVRWRLGAIHGGSHPTAVTMHENRLSIGVGNMIYMGVPGDYDNMAPTEPDGRVLPESAIAVQIPAYNSKKGAVSDVNVLKSYDYQLFVGTPAGNFTVQSNSFGEGITSENVTIRPQEGRGAARREPEIIGSSIVYAHSTLSKVMGTYEKPAAGRLGAQDLSLPADNLAGKGIEWLSYQEDPHGILWCGLADGNLAALTIQPEEKVQAWHEHRLGGRFISNGRSLHPHVESGCVVPGDDGTRDVQMFVVKRTIGGVVKRFIEALEPHRAIGDDLKESFFLDGALKYSGNTDETATLSVILGDGPTEVRTLASTNCPAFTAGRILSLHDGRRWHRGRIETVFGSNDLTWRPIAPNAPPGPADGRRWFFVDGEWTQPPAGTPMDVYVSTYEDFDQKTNIWKWSIGLTTLSGLEDYEGEAIDLLVDGNPMFGRTVIDGKVTGIPEGTIIVAGFHEPATGKLLSIEAGSQNGSAQGKQRPVYEIAIDVCDTPSMQAGTGKPSAYDSVWEHFQDLPFPERGGPIEGEPLPAHTGLVVHTRDENFDVENPSVAFRQNLPLPSFVRGIIIRLSESDGR